MEHILILAGPRGAGKTTACQRFAQLALGQGLSLGGVLSPGRWDESGAKVGIDAIDLATGERRSQAWVEPDETRRTVGQYRFDPAVLSWAVERVLAALNQPGCVVLVDEIGPLELLQGKGFAPVLDHLLGASARAVILLVRVELTENLVARLGPAEPQVIPLTLRNRDQVPSRLLGDVWPADRSQPARLGINA